MPRFRLKRDTFIAPRLFKAGTVIEYDGPLGEQFQPLDKEGEKALAAYYEEHPSARRPFTENLRTKGGKPGEFKAPTAEVVEEPPAEPVEKAGNLAQPGKAAPGPSDGGEVTPQADSKK